MPVFWRKKKKAPGILCSAVVVAAGSSTRMGTNKLMLTLGGIPVIVRTLKAVEAAPSVDEIILVTREDMMVPLSQLCQEFALTKVTKVIRGGKTRTESVRLGTLEASGDAQVIAIHDGARPLVTTEVIENAIAQALESGAAAPAVPVKDTIKTVAEDGAVTGTPDRSTLRAVQTPQVFEADLLKAALQSALENEVPVTDDCSAVERLGKVVYLIDGNEENLKITTPVDLVIAEAILAEREGR